MGAFLDKPKTEKQSQTESNRSITYGLSAMQGWRIEMEDAHISRLSLEEPLQNWSFFGVFDGHAGANVSALCAERVLSSVLDTSEFKTIKNDLQSGAQIDNQTVRELIKTGVRAGFLNLDDALSKSPMVESGEDKSGSTAVCVFVTPDFYVFANCGDSRAILVRDKQIAFSTIDHKPMNPGERDRIVNAGGTVLIQRVNGTLAVSRSLGDFDYKKVENKLPTEQLVSGEPEVTIIDRNPSQDQLIVLACDGIWDVYSNEELAEYVLQRCLCQSDPSIIAEEIMDTCLYKGSRDNMSVTIIDLEMRPKCDEKMQALDKALDKLITGHVTTFLSNRNTETDMPKMLEWLDQQNLPNLPPGGLVTKRNLIDPVYEKNTKDQNTPKTTTRMLSVEKTKAQSTGEANQNNSEVDYVTVSTSCQNPMEGVDSAEKLAHSNNIAGTYQENSVSPMDQTCPAAAPDNGCSSLDDKNSS